MTPASAASFEIKLTSFVFGSPPKVHETAAKFESLCSISGLYNPKAVLQYRTTSIKVAN